MTREGTPDAERVDALLRPHRVRRVIGDDADQRRREPALAPRAPEHDERQVMRRDDRPRTHRDDLVHELREDEVIEPAPHRVERPALLVRLEVRRPVELRRHALPAEVRCEIRLGHDARRQIEQIDRLDREPTRARRLGGRHGRGFVTAADRRVDDGEIGTHGQLLCRGREQVPRRIILHARRA
jgi:hypothetical protein